MDSLVQTYTFFSKDIEMEFVIQKCTMSVIEKRRIVKLVVIELPDGKAIKSLVLKF